MPLFVSIERAGLLWAAHVGAFAKLYEFHGLRTGSPGDFLQLGPKLASSEGFRLDFSERVRTVRDCEEGRLSAKEMLTILSLAVGGPGIARAEMELVDAAGMLQVLLAGVGGWSEAGAGDGGRDGQRGLARGAAGAGEGGDGSGRSGNEPAEQPGRAGRVNEVQQGGREVSPEMRETLARLELANMQLQIYLDDIDRRIGRIEPNLEDLTAVVHSSAEFLRGRGEAGRLGVEHGEARWRANEALAAAFPMAAAPWDEGEGRFEAHAGEVVDGAGVDEFADAVVPMDVDAEECQIEALPLKAAVLEVVAASEGVVGGSYTPVAEVRTVTLAGAAETATLRPEEIEVGAMEATGHADAVQGKRRRRTGMWGAVAALVLVAGAGGAAVYVYGSAGAPGWIHGLRGEHGAASAAEGHEGQRQEGTPGAPTAGGGAGVESGRSAAGTKLPAPERKAGKSKVEAGGASRRAAGIDLTSGSGVGEGRPAVVEARSGASEGVAAEPVNREAAPVVRVPAPLDTGVTAAVADAPRKEGTATSMPTTAGAPAKDRVEGVRAAEVVRVRAEDLHAGPTASSESGVVAAPATMERAALVGRSTGDTGSTGTTGATGSARTVEGGGTGDVPMAPAGRLALSAPPSGGVVISAPAPAYPAQARQLGVQGKVVVRATVDGTGQVTGVQVLDGPVLFHQSAIDAVRRRRYQPFVVGGKPTSFQTVVTLNYRLGN